MENLPDFVFSHLDHQGCHCSYSHFQSLSVLLSKLPILGYFLEPIPFSVLKQNKIEHSSSCRQNILQTLNQWLDVISVMVVGTYDIQQPTYATCYANEVENT